MFILKFSWISGTDTAMKDGRCGREKDRYFRQPTDRSEISP
jgi:hypothetical protein